jgi:hypothetical protein
MRSFLPFFISSALSLGLLGCGSKAPADPSIPLAEVAPQLVEVAQKTLPDVKFESARKKLVNGEEVFEIRGKLPNGKVREVEVSGSGQVVEVE